MSWTGGREAEGAKTAPVSGCGACQLPSRAATVTPPDSASWEINASEGQSHREASICSAVSIPLHCPVCCGTPYAGIGVESCSRRLSPDGITCVSILGTARYSRLGRDNPVRGQRTPRLVSSCCQHRDILSSPVAPAAWPECPDCFSDLASRCFSLCTLESLTDWTRRPLPLSLCRQQSRRRLQLLPQRLTHPT